MWDNIKSWVKFAAITALFGFVLWNERDQVATSVVAGAGWLEGVWSGIRETLASTVFLLWAILIALMAIIGRLDRIIRLLASRGNSVPLNSHVDK
jgi:hypothetical protein